jgi:hypothetical protein
MLILDDNWLGRLLGLWRGLHGQIAEQLELLARPGASHRSRPCAGAPVCL